ncbi:phosphatidylinositol N-acetylglucosaminyltransferase subunit P [Acrasis kona]|uniref:Phosphatidylinositol N-acetylglucosaminyltransferase subunit P n=1 Tax=Acrasis kona TaxID=1008807 RepID=A0AAW2YUX2_9EUKA
MNSALFSPLPPVENKRPQAEVYGFVLWIATFFILSGYLLFSWLPPESLYSYGITYHPDRYWALSIPAYIPFSYGLIGITMNFLWIYHRAQPLDDFGILEDEYTNYAVRRYGVEVEHVTKPVIPPVKDIPITKINQVLYHKH